MKGVFHMRFSIHFGPGGHHHRHGNHRHHHDRDFHRHRHYEPGVSVGSSNPVVFIIFLIIVIGVILFCLFSFSNMGM